MTLKPQIKTLHPIVQKIQKHYPDMVNEEGQVLVYENHEKVFKTFTPQLRERTFFSLFTGRHHVAQNYPGMKTELEIDYSNIKHFSKNSGKVDVAVKDLQGKVAVIIENGILEDKSLENLANLANEKIAQAVTYIVALMHSETPLQINNDKVFLQINIYNPDIILKNNKQFETYMSDSTISEEELYLETGMYQLLYVISKEDCEQLYKNHKNGVQTNEVNDESTTVSEVLKRSVSKTSTNFNMTYAQKVEKSSTKYYPNTYEIIPIGDYSRKEFCKKVPRRSPSKGGNACDNTREVCNTNVEKLEESMAKTFLQSCFNNNFPQTSDDLWKEIRDPGWNRPLLEGSIKESNTMTKGLEDDCKILIISANLAMANGQHQTGALIRIKNKVAAIKKLELQQQQEELKNWGIENAKKYKQEHIDSFIKLLEEVNPRYEFKFFDNLDNAQSSAGVSNHIQKQSELDQAKYSEKNDLNNIRVRVNIATDKYHVKAGVDSTQDDKFNINPDLITVDLCDILDFNTGVNKGQKLKTELTKKSMAERKKEIAANVSSKSPAQIENYLKYRSICLAASKSVENAKNVALLAKDNIDKVMDPNRVQERLIEFLMQNQIKMNKFKEVNALLNEGLSQGNLNKKVRKEFTKIQESLKIIERAFNIVPEHTVEEFINDLNKISATVKVDRVLKMIEAEADFNTYKNKKDYAVLFTKDDQLKRLAAVMLGYINGKAYEINTTDVQDMYNKLVNNIKACGRDTFDVVSTRNKPNAAVTEEDINILEDLFDGII